MRTITIANRKGGVGKTSVTMHLAGALAKGGLRVLVVDNDSQASLSQGFLGSDAALAIPALDSIATIYRGRQPLPGAIIRPAEIEGIDLVPGSAVTEEFNAPQPAEAPEGHQGALREFLAEVEGYDLCLIDCPPNLNLCTWAAMVASDGLLIPTQTEDFGVQGLSHVIRCCRQVQDGPNPSLAFLGYVLSMIDRRLSSHRAYEERLLVAFGPDVFASRVPRSVAYSDAISARLPVEQYDRRSAAAKAIRELADEVLLRLNVRAVPLEAAL